jgi:hypothetical protein
LPIPSSRKIPTRSSPSPKSPSRWSLSPPATEPPPPPPPEPLDFEHDDPGDVIEGTAHIQVDEGFHRPGDHRARPALSHVDRTGLRQLPAVQSVTWSWEYYPHSGTIDGVRYERPQGWEYSAQNYAYPWVDNFCEIRTHTNTRCGAGIGHEGQDIRPGRLLA